MQAQTLLKYDRRWTLNQDFDSESNLLLIEMTMARGDSKRGKAYHYNEMRKLLWPELDDHRWHNLVCKVISENKCTVLAGPASTGKTHEAAWWFLCDYWLDPENTCVLVSSTDIRGLRGRIWSEITSLWQKGRDKFPWLAGNLLDSRVAILTDALDEETFDRRARDYRKCIQGIPCRNSSGGWTGINRYAGWKQKRMRLIADEACFPAGTMVDTPNGPRPIQEIKTGDFVYSALGISRVRKAMKFRSGRIVTVKTTDGRSITCTDNHPFFTLEGWKKACHLRSGSYMVSAYEAMSIMRGQVQALRKPTPLRCLSGRDENLQGVQEAVSPQEPHGESVFLQQVLQREMEPSSTRTPRPVFHRRQEPKDFRSQEAVVSGAPRGCCGIRTEDDCVLNTGGPGKNCCHSQENTPSSLGSRGERNGSDCCREDSYGCLSGVQKQLRRENIQIWTGIPDPLQNRRGHAQHQTCHRSRWGLPQLHDETGTGYPEDLPTHGTWVDRVEVLQPDSFRGNGASESGVEVYNLEVEGHPSFSVNGLLVHNSQMEPEYLGGVSNLNSNADFRCVIMGNFSDLTDPLGKCAEPADGWSNHMAPMKTEVWDTFFPLKGKCVNLIGFDSPNYDYPKKHPLDPDRYPYLLGPKRIEEIKAAFGETSDAFMFQCWGCAKVSVLSHRVLTRELCEKMNVFEDVTWEGSPRTKVAFLDSAWGGDRCVFTWAEFGRAVGGKLVLRLNPPEIVPMGNLEGRDVDYVIADWVKERCESLGIAPENFGHDSTGRGSLGTALAKIWSAECLPIEFGGQPTDRPVTTDFPYFDPITHERREKLASEHYIKFVSELWYSVRYCVEAGQLKNLSPEVMDEFCMRNWKRSKDDKIEVEPKSGTRERPGMKQRTGRSPDLADSASGVLEMARRRGFEIENLTNEAAVSSSSDWMRKLGEEHRAFERRGQLLEV